MDFIANSRRQRERAQLVAKRDQDERKMRRERAEAKAKRDQDNMMGASASLSISDYADPIEIFDPIVNEHSTSPNLASWERGYPVDELDEPVPPSISNSGGLGSEQIEPQSVSQGPENA